jgi:hypothetical protein
MWVDDATRISPELYDQVPELAEGAGHLRTGGLSPEGRGRQGSSEKEDEKDARRTEAAHGVPFRKATPERALVPARAGLTSHMVPRDD